MLTTSLERHDGRPALVRRADGDDAEALREEVAALTALADLAVPQVLAWHDVPAGVEAVTSYVPTARGLTMEQLAAAAAVLASAHSRHIAHGGFSADSVRVDGDGQITVDGWLGVARKSDDVAAVGAILDRLLEPSGSGGSRRLALTGLAARAGSPDPSTRPGMTALADGIRPRPEPAATRDHRHRPGTSTATQPAHPEVPTAAVARPTLHTLLLGGAFALLAGVLGVVAAPRASSAPSAPAELAPRGGPVLVVGADRVRVGETGDLAVAGRWRCAPDASPAVLRTDGSVWLWSGLGGEPELVGTVTGGDTIERGQGDDGCDTPLVRDRAGNPLTINP